MDPGDEQISKIFCLIIHMINIKKNTFEASALTFTIDLNE